MTPAGLLRHRVDVLRRQDRLDAAGQPDGSWVAVRHNVPARVEFSGGAEGRRGELVESVTTHRVTLRRVPNLTAADRLRVVDTGELLEIESIGDPTGERREWLCVCRSVAG